MNTILEHHAQHAPTEPGVYLMKDANDKIRYIGKALNIRDRIKQYATKSDFRMFVQKIELWIHSIDFIVTSNEQEALLLENELIKYHRPKYNIRLTDDKHFLRIKIQIKHRFPKLETVRKIKEDGALYFGPYASSQTVKHIFKILHKYFQIRNCSDTDFKTRKRPCLQYQIKRCPAPCVYPETYDFYQNNIQYAIAFLKGEHQKLISSLKNDMQNKSKNFDYETAAQIRDQIYAIERIHEKQSILQNNLKQHADVLGIYKHEQSVIFCVLEIRSGRLLNAQHFTFHHVLQTYEHLLEEFLPLYYLSKQDVPNTIILPQKIQFIDALTHSIFQKTQKKVAIEFPKQGTKKEWLNLAYLNAEQAFAANKHEQEEQSYIEAELMRTLFLPKPPKSIECFDISHFQSSFIVGSCVRLEHGKPNKAMYKRYKIQSTQEQNDFQSMYEMIYRRAKRGLKENNLPDLMLIDGGKGQLNAAYAALKDAGIPEQPVVALAKSRMIHKESKITTTRIEKSFERVFVLQHKDPIALKPQSHTFHLLTRARNEAHRFAIRFQRHLQRKNLLTDTEIHSHTIGKNKT